MSNQDLIFECIKAGSFNDFDGPKVVEKLREHADLWEAVVASDENGGRYTLRDLPDSYHLSALYVRSSGKDDKALVKLLKRLKADEVGWCDDDGWPLYIPDRRVLRAWWD